MTEKRTRTKPASDASGAFVPGPRLTLAGATGGPLSGLTFAVKDTFDVAGHVTGNGHPRWLETHEPARKTAWAVQRLIDRGADLIGKTQCDEIQYSLSGENARYGTPVNPAAPDRIPGGSSSGSAVVVAARLADFALGTDCGGSVRLPASHCGIFGFRPTHGRVSGDGCAPLAPSFDTVGWFAREARVLRAVGAALIDDHATATAPKHVIVADDAFALAGERVCDALADAVELVSRTIARPQHADVAVGGLNSWVSAFRTLQGSEVWAIHRQWIESAKPDFGPGIRERIASASAIRGEEVDQAQRVCDEAARRLRELLRDDTVLCLPTAPAIAPLRGTPQGELEHFRAAALSILCIAGLASLPQVSLSLATLDGCPVGLSLVGPPGRDTDLLTLATRLTH